MAIRVLSDSTFTGQTRYANFGGALAFNRGNGYLAGGVDTSQTNKIDKLSFSDDSISTIATTLSSSRQNGTGFASGTAGYHSNGRTGGAETSVTTVDKITFSNDSRSTLGTGTPTELYSPGSWQSSDNGYVFGGLEDVSPYSIESAIYKFAFSNDARSTVSDALDTGTQDATDFFSDDAGYVAGGDTTTGSGGNTDIIQKMVFSSEAVSTLVATLSSSDTAGRGVASSSAGYHCGGIDGSTNVSKIEKLSFVDDSISTLVTTLSSARRAAGGCQSSSAGYIAGGFEASTVATVDKIDFGDDSRTSLASGLPTATRNQGGFESPDGWS